MRERKIEKYLIKSPKQMLTIIAIFTLIIFVGGTTYAFFNYNRTGPANTLNTGRIYFSTEQTNQNTITLNNIFPMTKEQALADTSTNGTLVVTFNGDTTYTDGMEYLLSIDSVSRDTNVPISLIMDVNITENSVAVAENTNYYTARNSKDTSMYKTEGVDTIINSTNYKVITDIETGKYLLAGYIKSGQYGVNGTLTIKAFIDTDNILITDTPDDQSKAPTGYTDGTVTTEKTVISTDDWNALKTNGIIFKVKGEARPGIWVRNPNATATFDVGSVVNTKLKLLFKEDDYLGQNLQGTSISNITDYSVFSLNQFVRVYEKPNISDFTNKNIISSSSSEELIYAWKDDENNIYWYTDARDVYLNADSSYMFDYIEALDYSGLETIDSSNATNMAYMFNGLTMEYVGSYYSTSKNLFDKIANWDVSNVTNMSGMFKNSIEVDFSKIANWDVSSVTNMSEMFRGVWNVDNCGDYNNASPINNWNVRNVSNFNNMFEITSIGCVPSDFTYPIFTLRPGTWDNTFANDTYAGTYVFTPVDNIDDICPNCVFISTHGMSIHTIIYTKNNLDGKTPTVITNAVSYSDVEDEGNLLGVVLDSNNMIDKAYICGVNE